MRKRVLILAAAVLLALVLAVPASASKRTPVSGSGMTDWLHFEDDAVAIGNRCFVEAWYTTAYTGGIEASCKHHSRQVAHGPCEGSFPGSYKETVHLESECTTTGDGVGGKQGTFRLRSGNGEIVPADPPQVWVMDLRHDCVILGGTGDLANLHGSLRIEWHPRDPETFFLVPETYSGEIHFDPN